MSIGRNVIKLTSSRLAVLLLSFISAPIIARLFLPEHFGIFQIFGSIAGIIGVITCLGYELSIPLGVNKKETSASFIICLFFTLIFTLLVLAAVPFSKGSMARWFKTPELSIFLWLLPLAVFIGGVEKPLRYWAVREGRFGAVAWAEFCCELSGKLVNVAWALIIGASALVLFAGHFVGISFGIFLLLVFLGRRLVSDIKESDLDLKIIWTVAKKHKKFPIFSTWTELLNAISVQLPPIILGLYFSMTVVGYYSIGKRLVSLPMMLLGSSIRQVFFPTAAKEYNETGTLSAVVSNIFRKLVQIGVFPIAALGLLGGPLFGFVFGEKWIEAGVYAQILSAWTLIVFISAPLSTVFSVLQRQGTGLAFNIGLVVSRTLALLVGAQTGEPRITLAIFVIVSVIGWSFMLCWILRNSEVSLRWGIKTILKYAFLSSLLLLPACCFAWIWGNMFLGLTSLGFATIIYVYGLYHFDPGIRDFTADTITRVLLLGRWNKKEKSQ
ncbi:MAG TPA: oligosaccharide flippase family protein [Sedimentisphaerales bacterium]|nr:oligosaccharide flippase family protein [Sedimentisphaerales bacterium]